MPLYEYVCPKCGHAFEDLVRSADADRQKCPKCQAKVERKFSTFSASVAPDRPSAPAGGCAGCPSGGGACPYK